MDVIRRISLYLQAAFYTFAGFNHFLDPSFYEGLIPDYIPLSFAFINAFSGMVEILLGLGLLFPQTRRMAATGLVLMLIAFIPSHVWFIQIGGCVSDGLCAPLWLAWVRLVVIHPLLMWWAWKARD